MSLPDERRPATVRTFWVLLVLLGGGLAWLCPQLTEPPSAWDWPTALRQPTIGMLVTLALAGALIVIGLLGVKGLLPGAYAPGAKVKWSIALSALVFIVPALLFFVKLQLFTERDPAAGGEAGAY